MSIETIDGVELEQDGLRVAKSARATEDGVTQVVFDLASEREDPITVRLVDPIPAALPDGEVGLHPDHRDHWVARDHKLVFERRLEPGESVTTLYGINSTDEDVVSSFLEEPDLVVEPRERAAPKSDGGSVRESPAAPLAMSDVLAAVEAADPEERAALRRALDEDDDSAGSVDARIRHLQNEVADLSAYSDALAEFLDENGGARELISDFESEVESLRADLDAVGDTVDDHGDRVAAVADRVADVEETLADLTDTLETIEAEVEAGRQWRAGMAEAAGRHSPATDEESTGDDRPAPGGDTDGPTDEVESSPDPDPEGDADVDDASAVDEPESRADAEDAGETTPDASNEHDGAEDPFAPADPGEDPLGGVGTPMDGAQEDEDAEADAGEGDDPFGDLDDE